MKLAHVVALLSLSLAACGGKSKPADTAGDGDNAAKVAADCCCDFIEETMIGDGSEDTAENQVYRMMSAEECEQNSGTCVTDDAQCQGDNTAPEGADTEDGETVGD
jgi:hypothetical protein